MSISDKLLPEFDQEMAATRRVLERVPSDKPDWKPHPKSFSMAHLAQLLSKMPGWIAHTVAHTELELGALGGYSNEKTSDLLAQFDKHVKDARAAIAASRDADYDAMWSLKRGATVLMSMPRGVVVRQHMSHISHHRGQMTVYLRLNDIAVPSIYGPTADERSF
ncbi:MAG TPA: DinB family protein [Gemmatimonadaceae bacterium]